MPRRRRRSATSARRRQPVLRVGLIVAVLWLVVAALWPVVYPFYLRGRVQGQVDAIQAVIGPPEQPAGTYPASLSELKALCKARGVAWKEDPRWYQFTYDPRQGRVGYEITLEGLLIREHLVFIAYQRVQEVLIALVLLVVAAGVGQRILRWIGARGLPLTERLLFGAALGLGVMALVTLLFGVLGWLSFWPFLVVLVLMGLLGGGPLVDDVRELYRGWRATTTHMGLWSGLMVAAGVLFVALPLLGAFRPPADYDALEYHLGAPAEYYVNGRITRLEGNCYSNFPFNIEMLYLMSMVLRRSVMAGTYLARVLNVLLGVLCALSVWAFGRRFLRQDGTRAGGIGCLLFLSCPWFFWVLTSVNVYVTLGLALYSFLAVYAALIHLYGSPSASTSGRAGPGGGLGILVLMGMLIGLAMGAKYTAAVFTAVPLVGWVAVVEIRRRGRPLIKRFGRVALPAVVAAALVSPWLIKNVALTGNPTYPLLYRAFGGVDWNEEQDARWRKAHGVEFQETLIQRCRRFLLGDYRIVILIIVFFPFALSERSGRAVVLGLVGYLCYWFLVWYLFTHKIERLLFPAFMVMMALAGWGYAWLERSPARWLARLALAGYLIYMAMFGAWSESRSADLLFEHRGANPLRTLRRYWNRWGISREFPGEAFLYIQQARRRGVVRLAPDSRLLLVGEAETFYLSAFGERDFIRSTVFDRNPFWEMMQAAEAEHQRTGRDPDDALVQRLREHGVRYLLVNFVAIRRFRRNYNFPFQGRMVPGYPPEIDEPLFLRLVHKRLLGVPDPVSEDGNSLLRPLAYENDDPRRRLRYAIYVVTGPGGTAAPQP